MLTDWLLNKIRDAILDASATVGSVPSHIAIGTGDLESTGGDTELQTEYVRKAIEFTDDSINKQIVLYCTYDTTEGNTTIREFAGFDQASGGNMHFRENLPTPYTKTNSVELRLIVTINFESYTE